MYYKILMNVPVGPIESYTLKYKSNKNIINKGSHEENLEPTFNIQGEVLDDLMPLILQKNTFFSNLRSFTIILSYLLK